MACIGALVLAASLVGPAAAQTIGDVATANSTIAPERAERIAFTRPVLRMRATSSARRRRHLRLDDFVAAGLHLRPSSSYSTHVRALSEARAAAGAAPIPVIEVEETLEDYILIDMVQAGLIPAIVVDEHKARFWAQIFEGVRLDEAIGVNEGGEIAWAVR